jgi:hypothetical protein
MNAMSFITPDERLARAADSKIALFGPSGVGKTHIARTLDPDTTLFIDGEAGTLALGAWRGNVLDVRAQAAALGMHPWELCRALACLLAGPDVTDYDLQPAGRVPGPYSPEAYATYVERIGDPAALLGKFRTIFVDSITVASRWSFAWAGTQPESISDKGKKDNRGTYGLHGREMVRWLTQLQHAPKNIIVVGILDQDKDELNRPIFSPQIEGGKAGRELPGIFDNVLTLGRFKVVEGAMSLDMAEGDVRALVCRTINPWGVPAKDRSGALDLVEPPDLGALLEKIRTSRLVA